MRTGEFCTTNLCGCFLQKFQQMLTRLATHWTQLTIMGYLDLGTAPETRASQSQTQDTPPPAYSLVCWLDLNVVLFVLVLDFYTCSREATCCLWRLPCHWQTGLVCSFIRWSFFTKGWIFIMLMGVWLSISRGTVRVLCTSVMSCWRKAWDGSHGEAGIVRIFSQMKIYGWSSHCFAGPYRILKKWGGGCGGGKTVTTMSKPTLCDCVVWCMSKHNKWMIM